MLKKQKGTQTTALSLSQKKLMTQKVVNMILRKKVLWAEIKAKEQEFKRIQIQINELEEAKSDVCFEVQKRLKESQEIAEYLDTLELENQTNK